MSNGRSGVVMSGEVGVLVLIEWKRSARLAGFVRLALGPRLLGGLPGLSFVKSLGTGVGGGFGLAPSFSHHGLMLSFDDEASADAFLESPRLAGYRRLAASLFTVKLRAFSARGRWSGREPFAISADPPRGPVAAGSLQPGDRVMTRDQGAVPLVSVTRLTVPGRGMLAPIRLRAPYYGRRADILVSPDQTVWIGGAEAEYLFGEEEVLVRARHLADGAMAVAEKVRAAAVGVVLDLGLPELVEADGCLLATAGPEGVAPARRLLEEFEVAPLRTALGRTQRRAE